ncbi:MAG: histidine kinase [Bacteroidetes bacterium]|nr:histidine kinase [Bacteroidota bacterium]
MSAFLCCQGHAQEYNYVHYDTKDGLAGNTVYCITEDKKGYLWFATENGVSRFDGKNFTNFTTDDGLTDNEVLSIAADSKGRVWMMPFNKTLCYYKDSKVINLTNDSSMKKINFTEYINPIGENKKGDYFFMTSKLVFCYTTRGEIEIKADYKKLAEKYQINAGDFYVISSRYSPDLELAIYNKNKVFIDRGNGFEFYKAFNKEFPDMARTYTGKPDYELTSAISPPFSGINSLTTIKGTKDILVNSNAGTWRMDSNGNILPQQYLKGKKTSFAIKDREGNLWFSTLGEGVYRLTSGAMHTYNVNTEALSVTKFRDDVCAGFSDGRLLRVHVKDYTTNFLPPPTDVRSNSMRLFTLKSDGEKTIYMGYDSHLGKYSGNNLSISPVRPIKSIDIIDQQNIVICTNFFIFRMNTSPLKIADTLFRERGTKVLYDRGQYYFGTLNGLVILDSSGHLLRTAEKNPQLSGRVVDMQMAPDRSVWIATNDKGIIHYKDGRVISLINYRTGLSSNGCRSLFLQGSYLWAGTNKGINKIDTRTHTVVAKYTVSDGLPSDNINGLYVEGPFIWVASSGGLTYYNEKDISDSSICLLDLHTIEVGGMRMPADAALNLGYRQNNISFSYTAISFKSSGEILYKYKLKGLDDDWNETKLTSLSYPTLPPGQYTFELYAINKFGKQSERITISFHIATPFWKTTWFWLLISLSAIALVSWLITLRFKTLQRRAKEKNDLHRKIGELEQASMRAQMNPHFIFNCLNSIQHFILKKDIENTNRYITQFASLIRQTLDNAARTNITIADEIRYLTSYMELERMRFPDAFHYKIELDPTIETDYTCVPSMVLQPFVENAIRHGIRNKTEGVGHIIIAMRQNNKGIHFVVEDNGVGRAAASRLKSEQHIEYQSKGISLATNRLDLLSTDNPEAITTTIHDLTDSHGTPSGTRVQIFFPHSLLKQLN